MPIGVDALIDPSPSHECPLPNLPILPENVKLRMSLRTSAHTGVAIRIPIRFWGLTFFLGERIATPSCGLVRNDIFYRRCTEKGKARPGRNPGRAVLLAIWRKVCYSVYGATSTTVGGSPRFYGGDTSLPPIAREGAVRRAANRIKRLPVAIAP